MISKLGVDLALAALAESPDGPADIVDVITVAWCTEHPDDTVRTMRHLAGCLVSTALHQHCGEEEGDHCDDAYGHIVDVLMETLLRQIAKALEM